METKTCKEIIDNFSANQVDIEDWRMAYPGGMSVDDLIYDDNINTHHDHDDFIYADGHHVFLSDACENMDRVYEI